MSADVQIHIGHLLTSDLARLDISHVRSEIGQLCPNYVRSQKEETSDFKKSGEMGEKWLALGFSV